MYFNSIYYGEMTNIQYDPQSAIYRLDDNRIIYLRPWYVSINNIV